VPMLTWLLDWAERLIEKQVARRKGSNFFMQRVL